MTVLNPCPFCGGNNLNPYRGSYVTCDNCDVFGPTAVEPLNAIDAWNNRALAPELLALIDAARAVNHDSLHGNGLEGFRKNRDRLRLAIENWEAAQ